MKLDIYFVPQNRLGSMQVGEETREGLPESLAQVGNCTLTGVSLDSGHKFNLRKGSEICRKIIILQIVNL